MIVELDKRNYCPVLDEMLKFYMNFDELISYKIDATSYKVKKFVEYTELSFDAILMKRGVWLCVAHFEFDKSLGSNSINGFVKTFENFVHLVIKEVKYIMGL